VTVITTIRGFGDLFWVDVVEQIDTMTEQVNNFQNQAKKLPKALRDWQAFVDCKKVIDDFLEELPLFQQLASKAMRPRYAHLLWAMCVITCKLLYLITAMLLSGLRLHDRSAVAIAAALPVIWHAMPSFAC